MIYFLSMGKYRKRLQKNQCRMIIFQQINFLTFKLVMNIDEVKVVIVKFL